jgi:hypothetical protein
MYEEKNKFVIRDDANGQRSTARALIYEHHIVLQAIDNDAFETGWKKQPLGVHSLTPRLSIICV